MADFSHAVCNTGAIQRDFTLGVVSANIEHGHWFSNYSSSQSEGGKARSPVSHLLSVVDAAGGGGGEKHPNLAHSSSFCSASSLVQRNLGWKSFPMRDQVSTHRHRLQRSKTFVFLVVKDCFHHSKTRTTEKISTSPKLPTLSGESGGCPPPPPPRLFGTLLNLEDEKSKNVLLFEFC